MTATDIRSLPGYRPFLRALERGTGRYDAREFFTRWLETTSLFLNAIVERDAFYQHIATLERPDLEVRDAALTAFVALAEQADWGDVLGPVYQELGCANARAGQAFTPWSLAYMMATMQMGNADDLRQQFEEKGRLSVCDPCCGSGVMLLAAAAAVRDTLGYAFVDKLDLYGQDLDARCVQMTRVQLRINGLDGVGRSLRWASRMEALLRAPKKEEDRPTLFSFNEERRAS